MYCALAVAALAAGACTTLRAPIAAPHFPPAESGRLTRDGVAIVVSPVVGEDEYLELFDDVLPQSGIAAVWVEISNQRATAIEERPEDWRLRTGGRDCRSLTVPQVLRRFYAAHHIRMYSTYVNDAARAGMEKVALQQGWIAPGSKRAGFVFFRIDPSTASVWERDASVIVQGLKLDRRTKTTFRIALPHANS